MLLLLSIALPAPFGLLTASSGTFWAAAGGVLAVVGHALFIAGVAGYLLSRRSMTGPTRIAWLLLIVLLPFVGGILYLRFGRVRDRRRSRAHRGLVEQVDQYAEQAPRPLGDRVEIEAAELRKGARLIEALGGMRPCGGNRLELYADGAREADITAALRRLIDDIDDASASCHLLFYIYLDDTTGTLVGEALMRAAARGVACRVLVDWIGSRPFLRSSLRRRMVEAGVEVSAALPVNPLAALFSRFDFRNHRKIAVLDGKVAWTGSQNLADPSFAVKARFAPWIDIMVRVDGPAVHDLQRIFVEDWMFECGGTPEDLMTERPAPSEDGVVVQILPSGPSVESKAMKEVTLMGFLETDHELILTTPYFVPDDATATALAAVARGGVRTLLVVPRVNDSRLVSAASRSYYEDLLEAGVEIFEYTDGLLHAKTFCFDGLISVVATANLDRRSYELNYEVSMVVADPDFTARLRDVQLSYLENSTRVDGDSFIQRPLWARLIENTAGLFAPLL